MPIPAHPSPIVEALPAAELALPASLRWRGLVTIFASTFFSLTGLFMFFPLIVFTLKAQGLSDALVGLVAASNWLGLALAAPFAGNWVARLGLRGALLASGALPLLMLAGIALTPWPALWVVLLLLEGMAGALRWIVAESTVAELAPAGQRGRVVGLFETMIGICFIVGPALLAALGSEGDAALRSRWVAVALAGMGFVLSFGVPALRSHEPAGEAGPRLGLRGIIDALRAAPGLMAAGAVGGVFEAGMSGVLPLYGLSAGFGAAMAALLVSASGLGSTLTMLPIGAAADRWTARRVSLACAAVNFGATLLLPLVPAWPPLAAVVAFLWGGAGGALYTLAMVDIGHRHQGVALVNTTAVLVLAYTLGGMLAPALGGLALNLAPGWGLPLLLALAAGLGWLALARR